MGGLGIGLSFVSVCILMGLCAEIYYFLWWKKRASINKNPEIEDDSCFEFSCEKPQEFTNPQEQRVDLETGSTKDNSGCYDEEGVEAEIMRIYNLRGPPRFLFTISEESKDDLETEDGKSRRSSRTKSLSDLLLSSPNVLQATSFLSDGQRGFSNKSFEFPTEEEINRLRSSPPPIFKFLKDAEDKLIRKG